VPAILKLNLAARTDVAYRNCGCATLITIAVMIPMSQLTCADRETAQPAGRDVLDNQTIDAYQNGCSVMAKTIAETTATNCQKTVQFVNRKLTSSATTIAASRNNGPATLPMIVEMVLMNLTRNAKESIANVLNLSSVAIMESASRAVGVVVS